MTPDRFHAFIYGALVMAASAAGLFFLRFWRESRDRLFLIFALAFWVLAANWLVLALSTDDETRAWAYLVRLAAFSLILIGIFDKNRRS